jgi:hypothetical protein
MCGVAITAALLIPIQTPDYERGFVAGYMDGKEDAEKFVKVSYEYGFDDGVRSAKN